MPRKKAVTAAEAKTREAARRKIEIQAGKKVANGQPLTEEQAAIWFSVCRLTLMRRRQANGLRYFRIGSRVFYDPEMLKEDLMQAAIVHQAHQAERSAA